MSEIKAIAFVKKYEGNPFILISIRNIGKPELNFQNIKLVDKLHLNFDDIVPNSFGVPASTVFENAMTEKHAMAIAGFVNKHKDVSTIVVHCQAGLSRSAAVAFAIETALIGTDKHTLFRRAPFMPNNHVYDLCIGGFGIKTLKSFYEDLQE